jgi:hypothetical protein
VRIVSAVLTDEIEYYTTVVYPIIYSDEMKVSVVLQGSPILIGMMEDSVGVSTEIVGVDLRDSIVYKSYTYAEQINTSVAIVNASLVDSIVYKTLETSDKISVAAPEISSASMNTTIQYIDYNNWAAENITVSTAIISGELT